MFECEACDKRMAYWQDGTEWEHMESHCEMCGTVTTSTNEKKYGVITTTYTCPKCGHIEKSVLDLNKDEPVAEEPVDPFYELDRKRFVFDSGMVQKYTDKAKHLERLVNLEQGTSERAKHIDVYAAIKEIKRLKIAQLTDVLREPVEKGGYSEFKLGEPELGQQVVISFSCLDTESDREEYQSKKALHELIDEVLMETNWRLMSDGVSYRLGYLTGRLRAYEKEEDLKKLVEQRIKDGTLVPPKVEPPVQPSGESKPRYEGMRLREAALVYMDKMTLGSKPAEITLKSGKKKATSIPILYSEMNPLLRVIIPMRDNDDTVPEFIRTFDFKMGSKDKKIPKVTKDSQGREIRLT